MSVAPKREARSARGAAVSLGFAQERGATKDDKRAELHVDERGSGAPVALIHGFASHAGIWSRELERLAHSHRVLAPDLPGHGASAGVASPTLAAMSAQVEQALARVEPPLVLIGWSFGATIAMRIAIDRPERVSKLVLVAATPRFSAAADWPHATARETLARFGDELEASYRLTLLRFLTLQVQGSEAGRAALGRLRRELFARGDPDPAQLAAALEALADADLRDELAAIRAPTLVISGGRDTLVPRAASAFLASAIPGARHLEIDGAAHAPFLSHAGRFDAALDEFLDAPAS